MIGFQEEIRSTITLDGHKHDLVLTNDCDKTCRRKENVSWCDECDLAYCSSHYDWKMVDDCESLCKECFEIKEHWDGKRK